MIAIKFSLRLSFIISLLLLAPSGGEIYQRDVYSTPGDPHLIMPTVNGATVTNGTTCIIAQDTIITAPVGGTDNPDAIKVSGQSSNLVSYGGTATGGFTLAGSGDVGIGIILLHEATATICDGSFQGASSSVIPALDTKSGASGLVSDGSSTLYISDGNFHGGNSNTKKGGAGAIVMGGAFIKSGDFQGGNGAVNCAAALVVASQNGNVSVYGGNFWPGLGDNPLSLWVGGGAIIKIYGGIFDSHWKIDDTSLAVVYGTGLAFDATNTILTGLLCDGTFLSVVITGSGGSNKVVISNTEDGTVCPMPPTFSECT